MTLKSINAVQAQSMLNEGAILIDIRDADEHAREQIVAALHIPLAKLCDTTFEAMGKPIIFHCKSGNRTRMNAEILAKAGGAKSLILEGGIEGWKAAGLATRKNTKQPIEMMRQVQIAAGGLTLLGAVLGFLVNPAFFALSGAIGVGLMFSGISGTCAMAAVLKQMPWNRVAA